MKDRFDSPRTGLEVPSPTGTAVAQHWNPSSYAANGRFVADLGSAVVALLDPQPAERILDIGCGDGALTQAIAATGARLSGVDASATMAEAARARGLDVLHASATDLPFHQEFDAVFSNAALHWIAAEDQSLALASIYRALKPGGRFVAEMGGQGNIAAIRTALSAVLSPLGIDAEVSARSFFPSPARYRGLLEAAGFAVHSIELHPRPTALPNGSDGMTSWLNTFRNGVLDLLGPERRDLAVDRVVALLRPILADPSGLWTADYVRLRFRATRA